jgi:hypothetical protein
MEQERARGNLKMRVPDHKPSKWNHTVPKGFLHPSSLQRSIASINFELDVSYNCRSRLVNQALSSDSLTTSANLLNPSSASSISITLNAVRTYAERLALGKNIDPGTAITPLARALVPIRWAESSSGILSLNLCQTNCQHPAKETSWY